MYNGYPLSIAIHLVLLLASANVLADDHLVFQPPAGQANGKQVVLISGDEEYRSEESCPMLGKILSQHHGFKCTVLFAIDKKGGFINPNESTNIPNTTALQTANLMIIGTRFRDLPESQLQPILDYLQAAKPVIGFRTATHAFRCDHSLGGFDWNNFGKTIIGENWVAHHGQHGVQGGRSMVVQEHADHPILRGVGQIFTKSDIYTVQSVTSDNATILLRGAVTESLDEHSQLLSGKKNDPMMPLAWLREYNAGSGKQGMCFATTAGASVDFADEGLRRLVVNATYFLTGLEVPTRADVEPVDPFRPSPYGFQNESDYFRKRALHVDDFALGRCAQTIPAPPHQESNRNP